MPKTAAARRLAVQLASQLPEGREKCLLVLDHLREMVDYLYPAGQAGPQLLDFPPPRRVANSDEP
jgi:hypothetical protein